MLRKMTLWTIFACLLIAIPLALLGYKKVELGGPFLSLLRNTSYDLNQIKFEIPSIPKIPVFETPKGFELVLNFLVKVVNGLSTIINVVILILNYVLQLLEFLVLLVRNGIAFKDNIQPLPQ